MLGVELLGALSETFENWIPWPTISGTVGHLEKRWDFVAVIVVGLLSTVAFHALATRAHHHPGGRTFREGAPPAKETSWYSPLLVFALTVVASAVPYAFDVTKFELGYTIYGTLGVFGILVPSILSVGFNRLVRFPTLFFTPCPRWAYCCRQRCRCRGMSLARRLSTTRPALSSWRT